MLGRDEKLIGSTGGYCVGAPVCMETCECDVSKTFEMDGFFFTGTGKWDGCDP